MKKRSLILLITLIIPALLLSADGWKEVFHECGSCDWQEDWFLEGDKATVENTATGMVFTAGPVPREHASHAVLWTKRSFQGDIKIEYDYTRLDANMDLGVNILYIQATGLGTEEYPEDIFLSTHKRSEPWMRYYFLYMNSLHISYATDRRYVSARRYPASESKAFQKGTQIQPVYNDIDLFAPGETWHITAIKEGKQLQFIAERNGKKHVFSWDTSQFPPVDHGRIGFRHMWTRSSRYSDIKIFEKTKLKEQAEN